MRKLPIAAFFPLLALLLVLPLLATRSAEAGERLVSAQPASIGQQPLTALQLAAVQGLTYADHGTYVLLQEGGVRLRAYPGTYMAVVGGHEYQLKDRIVRNGEHVLLTSRVARFLSTRVESLRSDERQRQQVLAARPVLEPLPPLPERPVLRISAPAPRPVPSAAPAPARRSAAAGQAAWVPAAKERKWRWIVLHHSDDTSGNMAKYDAFHRNEKRWEHGCGYHFVIGNGTLSGDGEVELSPRWTAQLQGAHAKVADNRYNEHGVGICLVGDFEKGAGPSAAQMDALVHLVRWLRERYDIAEADVKGHCDCCPTSCPGRNFPMAELRRRIR